jgi:hypothetical protein
MVNNALANTGYENFRSAVEFNLHDVGHRWVGGTMVMRTSPNDPVFYLHHNMVDKIWQDWHNLGRTTSFSNNVMPGFPTGVPATTPNAVIDSRAASLKVWFAENGQVLLDKYSVSNTENYRYTGTINVENNFNVPSATNCTMVSAHNIVLKPGFTASSGSSFRAYIDNNTFNSTGRTGAATADNDAAPFSEQDLAVFPNPSTGKFSVLLLTGADVSYTYEVFSLLGKRVTASHRADQTGKRLEVDLTGNAKGVYLLKLTVNNQVYTRRLILN